MSQSELLNVATTRRIMKLIIVGDVGEIFAEINPNVGLAMGEERRRLVQ